MLLYIEFLTKWFRKFFANIGLQHIVLPSSCVCIFLFDNVSSNTDQTQT